MKNDIYKAAEDRYVSGMKYRRSGKSGVMLPEISLGLWHNFGDTAPLARSREILLTAFDRGICHFDLANNYGPSYGSAESTFGQVMESDLRPYRDEMFISTKAGYDMWPGPYGDHGSRKYLMASLDQSLKRMKLDYVDVFYSHRFDPDTPVEETLQSLVDIVRSGKALYAGLSRYPVELLDYCLDYLAERDVPCLLHQCKYNMLCRDVEKDGTIEKSAAKGSGFIVFSPLHQGVLTDRYLNGIPEDSRASRVDWMRAEITPEVLDKVRKLNEIALRRGQTLAQMSLCWNLRLPEVTSVIVGASSVNQLTSNLEALNAPAFTDEELSEIETILR